MRLHIGNLPKTFTEPELKTLIAGFAEPGSLEIAKDNAGQSKGFAFVDVASDDGARAVIAGLDGKELDGRALKVSEARPRKGA